MASEILKGSESLCRLLRYLGANGLDSPGTPIKEYQIATEVFGRSEAFDPRLDSTVRVQTGRLRSKLAEYYAGPGAADQVLVELPKGSYSVTINERTPAEPPPPPPAPLAPVLPAPSPAPAAAPSRALVPAIWALACIALILLAALVIVVSKRTAPPVPVPDKAPAALRTFWHGFLDGPERPWVVFSNAEFVGRPETGMRYFNANRDSGTAILDHYTGVGEVLAIHELDRLFATLDQSIRVKRGRLLSIDDAKNNDLIFVGSPTENLSLREVPGTQEFVFRLAETGPRKGDLEIVNLHPRPDEPTEFWGSPAVPITEDHALIALAPGMNSSRFVMVLAGTTTIGTQAAVEYVTRAKDVEDLVSRAGVKDGSIRSFEAVIRVKVKDGVPVNSDLLALHARP